ncbi:porin [Burkholderia arboris]|uniref:porin n=2 Tax=Burkholderia TaxID=32008 RepID=UPI001CF4B959|nr:porin [Burkholderia arboris]MCA8047446.1 porin [Burkholderia arboris]
MKSAVWCGIAMGVSACASGAQAGTGSSVTLYGFLDAGVTYVSNSGGHGNLKFDDGISAPNLLGLRGDEDLGGGTHAVFDLVSQISMGTGAIQPPGKGIFGRNAWVGLTDDRFGSIKFGNQYDFMIDALFFGRTDAAFAVGGLYGFRAGPFQKIAIPYNPPYAGQFDWDRMSGQTVTNSIKYQSPSVFGFRMGAMYGFGGVPGSIGSGNSVSAGLNYDHGAFGAAAAYTEVKTLQPGGPQVGMRNWGVGARYDFGKLSTSALVTTVRNGANGGAIAEGELGATYLVTPALQLGASYLYMKGNAWLDNHHAHQLSASVDYFLSKRTTVYATAVYQRANADAQALISGILDPNGTSSGPNQFLARVGVQTRF